MNCRTRVDRLLISLRAYVTRAPRKPKKGEKADKATAKPRDPREYLPFTPPSGWVLVFDCENRTTPDQRLRFGGYQLRYKGPLWEHGLFYEPDVLSAAEQALLHQVMEGEIAASAGERIRVLTRAEFVEQMFYDSGQAIGAQIVGLDLPFDISRLAIGHSSARRSMRGGFSLTLSETRPAVAPTKAKKKRTSIAATSSM